MTADEAILKYRDSTWELTEDIEWESGPNLIYGELN